MPRWTPEARLRQAERIRQWSPWSKSTGPRTVEGKNRSKSNAWKGGMRWQARAYAEIIRLWEHNRKVISSFGGNAVNRDGRGDGAGTPRCRPGKNGRNGKNGTAGTLGVKFAWAESVDRLSTIHYQPSPLFTSFCQKHAFRPSTINSQPTAEAVDENTPVAATPEAPVDPLAAAQAEIERWKDLAYRSQAELDNYRKRTARDLQDARTYANADLLRSLLSILDNFEMGLEAARAESEKSMVFMGMTMVQRQVKDFLAEQGVQEVEAMGKAFDPNIHDAVAQEASNDKAEGEIIRVGRRGYKMKDRLLRAASVVVSSGPAKEEAA